MTAAAAACTRGQPLSLPDELILMLLNDQTGYFHQVPGWRLQCAVAGAALAELSLLSRIDTDMESLVLLDRTETGDPALDPLLKEIADEPVQRNARYWIERLAARIEPVIDLTLDNLVRRKILEHHDGDFWTLTPAHWLAQRGEEESSASQFIRTRISEAIFTDTIPDPRDVIVICLVNTCDVFRFMFELNEQAEERIRLICRMDLIGRSIAEAVEQNIVSPMGRPAALSRRIPQVPFHRLLLNQNMRNGNLPALLADFAKSYGPVFQLRLPFQKPMTILAGSKVNRWVHRNARIHMTSGNYFRELEEACGAQGLITSLDGADHFRLRKVMKNYYSAAKFIERLDDVCEMTRQFMSSKKWETGSDIEVKRDTRLMINLQMTQITVSTDSQDIFEDLAQWKERASNCYVGHLMPNFMARTPAMSKRFQLLNTFVRRIEENHAPYQRAGAARELADDLFSLHASDPQFIPEQNLPFMLAAAPILQSIYVGDLLGFSLFEMAKHPELAASIRTEANAFLNDDRLDRDKFLQDANTVTRRFLMECLRMYPIVCMQARNVANSCTVEDFSLPLGQRVLIAQSAAHYMSDSFPEPYKFDIDRYLPPRNEHRKPDYAPYGLGTHMCVGYAWMNLQMIVNLLMIAYYFELAPLPKNHKLKINPLPTLSVTRKLKLRIANQLHEFAS